jgi:hypothetical protein
VLTKANYDQYFLKLLDEGEWLGRVTSANVETVNGEMPTAWELARTNQET